MRGTGYASSHHGEILQGVFSDGTGRACRGLVTLPLTGLGTHAEFVREPEAPGIAVDPADRTKAARAAGLAARECARISGQPAGGGTLRLRSDIPVGLGMGSSTSDIIAAVRAVTASFGLELPPANVARLAVSAECACDPLMLDGRPTLFAQRAGRVLEVLGPALPAAVVLGCVTGGGRQVDTLALPPVDCGEAELARFDRLRVLLRRAVATGDVALLGHVSTESARHNQRVLAKDEFGVLRDIAAAAGAAGVQVAHSGNVAGLLFDPAVAGLWPRLRRCVRELEASGITVTRVFGTGQGGRLCTTTSRTRSASRIWSGPEMVSSVSASRR